jgi:hypothetical protein
LWAAGLEDVERGKALREEVGLEVIKRRVGLEVIKT